MATKGDVTARLLRASGLDLLAQRLASWRGLLVLNYHRVTDSPTRVVDPGVWSATSAELDQQLAALRQHADVIAPGDLDGLRPGPRDRLALVTFDDAYRESYDLAVPVLRRHGVAAIFFVVTGLLDRPRAVWWDEVACLARRSAGRRLPAAWGLPELTLDPAAAATWLPRLLRRCQALAEAQREQFLDHLAAATGLGRCAHAVCGDTWITWDMARELLAAGMAIGGHSVSHPVLAQLSPADQQREIDGCRDRLRAELGQPMRLFAYPYGGRETFNETTAECLRHAGVRYAFSQYGGYQPPGQWHRYDLRRVAIERWPHPSRFACTVALPQVFGRPSPAAVPPFEPGPLPDRGAWQVVTDEHEWAALEPAWRELFEASPTACAALRYEWLRAWWRHYADRAALRVLLWRRHGRLVAALPLHLPAPGCLTGRGVLRFLSTGEAEREETCADNLDLLYRPGHGDAAAAALAQGLTQPAMGAWSRLDLRGVAAQGLLARAGLGWTRSGGVPAFAADLTGGIEAYLARLSRKNRQTARQQLRQGAEAQLSFSIAREPAEVRRYFDELVALHQARWTSVGRPGCFAAPRFLAFHRDLVASLRPGVELLLARLAAGDEPLAVLYGFRHRDRLELYQTGVRIDGDGPVRSPGLVAHLRLIEELCAAGVTRLDFLRGRSGLKDRLATDERELPTFQAARGDVRRWAAAGDTATAPGLREAAHQPL